MNFEKDNVWLLEQVAWRGMLPAPVAGFFLQHLTSWQ
jgi:hypothetical protein